MKKICVVTATRAEYGVLKTLLKKIEEDVELELCLVVTGAHLSEKYGNTVCEIEKDGFEIAERIPILDGQDGKQAVIKTMANAMSAFGEAFERLKPDMVIVVGDRYELLPICESALILQIPIAHISGGEVTEGAIDDSIRHCVTKMSHLHFPGCETYCKRVIQLGENPETVFNYGDIGVENLLNMELMSKAELEQSIDFVLDKPYVCVTFHPVTLDNVLPEVQVGELLNAIGQFGEMKFIFTGANADAGGDAINAMVRAFVEAHENCRWYSSLGIRRYLSLLKNSEMILGNSSSGIIEAPCFGIPTINIGNRQKGRLMAESVINCEMRAENIEAAIRLALTPEFKRRASETINPYGAGMTSDGIVREVKKFLKGNRQIVKRFYDVSF